MDHYRHIEKMEQVMVRQEDLLHAMNRLMDSLNGYREEYRSLIAYYYSDQRAQDLEDDSNHLIPETMHRGVLSEDEIYELLGDYHDTAIRMLETAVQMLKE